MLASYRLSSAPGSGFLVPGERKPEVALIKAFDSYFLLIGVPDKNLAGSIFEFPGVGARPYRRSAGSSIAGSCKSDGEIFE